MLKDYNNFIIEEKFNSIITDLFLIVESNETNITDPDISTINWDYIETSEEKEKLKNFLKDIPEEKRKDLFNKVVSDIENDNPKITKGKKFSPKFKKRIIAIILSIFLLSVPSLKNLTKKPESENILKKHNIIPKKLSEFNIAQKLVKNIEKGYSDDRKDQGNYIRNKLSVGGLSIGKKTVKKFVGSKYGISAPVLQKFLGKEPTKEMMKNLDYNTALKIYKKLYWDPQNLDKFENQSVANIIYDGCVNQGVGNMKKILLEICENNNIEADTNTVFTESTITKLNTLNQRKLFNDIKDERIKKYKTSKTFKHHGEGWLNRIDNIKFSKDYQIQPE